ncbi:hypothetical protein FOBRF1_004174 [Fusarium oxysporum]
MSTKYINKLNGQRVLVIGGSTGIGFAVAEAALEHGANVVISSSNQSKIDSAIERLKTHINNNHLPVRKISGKVCNLAKPETIEANVKELLESASQDGKLDHVVFTAGDFNPSPSLDSATVSVISKTGMVRVMGALFVAKHLSSYINQTNRSSFTITGTTTDSRPAGAGWSVLKAAAGGIEPMARALCIDLKPVRVNCVTPGFVHTALFDGFPQDKGLEPIADLPRSVRHEAFFNSEKFTTWSLRFCLFIALPHVTMSSSLATQPFRHAGLPDVTIKGLGTALRTLPLFDTNKAFLRITGQPDRFSFKIDGTSKASSTLPDSNTSNLETLTGIQAVQYLADSTRATGVAEIRYDPNGIRQCVSLGETEKYHRDALTRVTFLLYADHVSEHLEKCKMPPLCSLARYDGFPKAFAESLSSEDSIDDMTEHMGLGEATWIEASLFLVQYFNQPERPQILSSNDIWKSPVGDIALKCIQQASGSPLAGRVALGALRALPVSYGIFDNEAFRPPVREEVLGLLQNMPFHPESGTKAEEILRQIQDLGGAEGWQSHNHELTVLWAKQQQIVSEEAENLARSVDTVPHSMISWQDLAADPFCTFYRASADFIVQRPGRLSQYKHQPPSNNGPGTCFVAGTKIITKSGNKPIEDLEENDWVLTNGANDEWGLVSDERVVIPVDSPIIYGFNDEALFFTAGHVFHTTTSFRALDAELAMKENPWAEVGRLSAGHILYRLGKDGRTYDQVPILGINWRQMPEVTEVYGVHLREGRRSYHANDYLVMVNYPEITLKRICSTLATFSQEDQVRLLQSLKELNPLFERFGIATVAEMVQREVDAAKNNLTARMYNVTENKLAGLAHASVCFNPEEIPTVDYSQLPYALPVVTLFDGVILVNGVVCEYGRVDNANSEVRWFRFISQNMVEHGVLSIQDPRYHSGIGQICYSTDYDGDDLLELPVFQYMTYGSECELEMDALSAGVTKQELIFK